MKTNILNILLMGLLTLITGLSSFAALPNVKKEVAQIPTSQDLTLSLKVREELARDSYLSKAAKNIRITVADGVVTLEGVVSRNSEMVRIEELAKKATQNAEINNQLQIQ